VTFEALAPWLAALVLIGTLYGLGAAKWKPGHVRQRSEAHEAYLAFLRDILSSPDVRRVMIREGTADPVKLAAFRDSMGNLSEPMLRACAAKLLDNRIVRRQVAAYVAKEQGGDRKKLMREFGALVGEAKG
jgi:hypothetical protein